MRITAVILSHSCDMYYSCDMYCISHCITHVTCISNMHAGRAPDWQQQLGKPRCHDGQGQACEREPWVRLICEGHIARVAVAEPAPPDELHLTSSHTDKLIAQLIRVRPRGWGAGDPLTAWSSGMVVRQTARGIARQACSRAGACALITASWPWPGNGHVQAQCASVWVAHRS